jgi:KaiC/GvpD/RAD55 family RecA-like ATPase
MESSTQDFLEFDQIRDGVIILKNKGLRMVLMVSSLNFALKSDEEQNAIIYQFQNFLNSLDFSTQILVQSRRLNITGYLNKLKKIEDKETNELLQIQIKEYRKFINQIISGGAIMQKTFYVIIPFSVTESQMAQGEKTLLKIPSLTEESFQRAKIQLLQRAEFTSLGLRSCGLQAVPLNNIELIELFWALHHQAEAEQGYYPEFPEEFR